jgi:sulfatase maturation enzyme AslB (radical SAM superfamily)
MNEETIERAIKFGETLIKKTKNFQLMLYGGEPFLYPNIVLKILKSLKNIADKNKVTLSAGATTNGSLITKGLLNKYSKRYFILR